MAAERLGLRRREGFALFAIVIGIVVISIIGIVMAAPISGDNKQERIQRAADILHRFVAEIDSASGTNVNYFRGHVALNGGTTANRPKWPGRLSQLYTLPVSTDLLCSGSAFSTVNNNWRGPYHLVPIKNTGHNIAPGFFADDAIVRVSNTEAYIRIQNVSLDDAKALDLTVDKALTNTTLAVRYALTSPTTTVEYHFIGTGAPCG